VSSSLVLRSCIALSAVTLLAGCYSLAQPSYRPGDPRDVLVALSRRGIEVERSVAGESACDDPGLVNNAVHMVITVPPDPTTHDVFLYTFRARNWEESKAAVDACQASLAEANPDSVVGRIDVPTYRVLGLDWPDELTSALRESLEEASEQGE
jgi:hypothetical protein